jgi:hypothetical protein
MRRLRNIAFAFLVIASVAQFGASGVKAGDYYFPFCNEINYYPAQVWMWWSVGEATAYVSDCEDSCANLDAQCEGICGGNGFAEATFDYGWCGTPSNGTCNCS